jgi:hypothetical protein
LIEAAVYNKEALAEIFSLRRGDIDILIESEAIPYFSTHAHEFVGLLPSLNASFKLENDYLKSVCAKNIIAKNYTIKLDNSVISIASKNPLVPASSYLFNNLWFASASRLLEINEEFSLLLADRIELPIFCGHSKMINRLSENFAGDIYLVNALEFTKKLDK